MHRLHLVEKDTLSRDTLLFVRSYVVTLVKAKGTLVHNLLDKNINTYYTHIANSYTHVGILGLGELGLGMLGLGMLRLGVFWVYQV